MTKAFVGFELMTNMLIVNAQTHGSMLLGNNFLKRKEL